MSDPTTNLNECPRCQNRPCQCSPAPDFGRRCALKRRKGEVPTPTASADQAAAKAFAEWFINPNAAPEPPAGITNHVCITNLCSAYLAQQQEIAELNKIGEKISAKLRQAESAFEIRGDHLKAAEEKIAGLRRLVQEVDGEVGKLSKARDRLTGEVLKRDTFIHAKGLWDDFLEVQP